MSLLLLLGGAGEAVTPPIVTPTGGGGGWPFGVQVKEPSKARRIIDWTTAFETTKEFFQPDETGLAPIDREIRDLLLNVPFDESVSQKTVTDSVTGEQLLTATIATNLEDLSSPSTAMAKEHIRKFNLALILLLEAA